MKYLVSWTQNGTAKHIDNLTYKEAHKKYEELQFKRTVSEVGIMEDKGGW